MLNKIPAPVLQLVAIGLLVLYPLAILLARFEVWDFKNSFLIFIVTALAGFVVLVLAMLKLPKKQTGEGVPLVVAIACTLIPLMVLGSNIVKARSVPFIHDVTTDFEQPPELNAAKTQRLEHHHPVSYAGEEIAQQQQAGYPHLQPKVLDLPMAQAFTKVEQAVADLGWEVIASNNQTAPYTLEAVDSSTLFNFKDDIAIRLTAVNDAQTKVDARSKSRVGQSDLGANAARIDALFELLDQ